MTAIDVSTIAQQEPSTEPIGLCLECGYALRGLPMPRCPECGREFDPMDSATMNMGRELSPLAKWVLGPVHWPINLLTWGALLFTLWMARLPGDQIGTSTSIVILTLLALLWLAWPIVRIVAARRYGWPHSLLMRGQKLRIAVGLCLMLGVVAIHFDLPLRAALSISLPAMDRMATRLIESGEPYADDQWVGVYRARRIKMIPGGVRFTCEEQNRAYRSGFTYLPKVDPKRTGWRNKSYRYVGGGWWAWREEG
jgi:hypothetical protein